MIHGQVGRVHEESHLVHAYSVCAHGCLDDMETPVSLTTVNYLLSEFHRPSLMLDVAGQQI